MHGHPNKSCPLWDNKLLQRVSTGALNKSPCDQDSVSFTTRLAVTLLFNCLCGWRNFPELALHRATEKGNLFYSVFPTGGTCVTLTETFPYGTNSPNLLVGNLKVFRNFHKSFTVNNRARSWLTAEKTPWDVDLPGIALLLSCSPRRLSSLSIFTLVSVFPSWQSGVQPPPSSLLAPLPFFLWRNVDPSLITYCFHPACPFFCWFVSIFLCHIFLDDFGEQRSLWPSDNNVLDQYILCVHVCVHKFVCVCVCVCV